MLLYQTDGTNNVMQRILLTQPFGIFYIDAIRQGNEDSQITKNDCMMQI